MSSAAYDRIGIEYASQRRSDPRLLLRLLMALGSSSSVVNVGAGTGSYEPVDRFVIAVEPSATMLGQREPGSAPAVQGVAENLPLADASVDAAMALFTIHHWSDIRTGLDELKRVARRRLVILTTEPEVASRHWMVTDYAPEMKDLHSSAFPTVEQLCSMLPSSTSSEWLVPADCSDLFFLALWARPELYLDPEVRAASSVWHQLPADVVNRAIENLAEDLESGRWDERHGDLRTRPAVDVGVRIVISDIRPTR